MNQTLLHFDHLTDLGLKVIPLIPFSKKPLCKGWLGSWDRDQARDELVRIPEANIGLLLGEIVDVEGDDEYSNRLIDELIDGQPHPCYRSRRSTHHLFVNPDPCLKIWKYQGVEFRGYRHQSVLPPSNHEGSVYSWINNRFPVTAMPERLLRFYNKKAKNRTIKPGHMKVRCFECTAQCYIHQKRFDLELEAFRRLGWRWHCQDCREMDLRDICRHLRQQKKA